MDTIKDVVVEQVSAKEWDHQLTFLVHILKSKSDDQRFITAIDHHTFAHVRIPRDVMESLGDHILDYVKNRQPENGQ